MFQDRDTVVSSGFWRCASALAAHLLLSRTCAGKLASSTSSLCFSSRNFIHNIQTPKKLWAESHLVV